MIIGGSGSSKTNPLLNLLTINFKSHQPEFIIKISLYPKDPHHPIYPLLIYKSLGLKHYNNTKAFIEYSNDMDDIYEDIVEYNSNKKCKILIAFEDMIANMLNNKKRNPIVTELFIRAKKTKHFSCFYCISYFVVPKNIRLNDLPITLI